MRLLFLGMDGTFSYPPLSAVLQSIRSGQNAGLEVAAVILPASAVPNKRQSEPVTELPPERPKSDLPLIQPYISETIIHLAWANKIPVYIIRNMRDAAVYTLFKNLMPDVACVACFPYLIPPDILTVPKHGFLNLHPSLLPAYRGPEPLFWILRNDDWDNCGVTLHWMDEGLDTGDILSQRPFVLPSDNIGNGAEKLLATVGGELLVEGLKQLAAGEVKGQPQPSGGSYYPYPTSEDFALSPGWSARRAYNFMRGTARWNKPYSVQIDSQRLSLRWVKWFNPNETLPKPIVEKDGGYLIQFSPGTILAYSFP